MKYLLQHGDWMRKEKMTVIMPDLPRQVCAYENLVNLPTDDYIPIGTVEYITKFAELFNITLPANISYPFTLRQYLKRLIWKDQYQNVEPNLFVKPTKTKTFTGDIKSNITEYINPTEMVWVSDPIIILNEYRFYINNQEIVGHSRYDATENPDIEPDIELVNRMIKDYTDQPIGYSIDIGIMNKNETVLIEVNDGWALGLYPWGNMTNEKYLKLITDRWKEII